MDVEWNIWSVLSKGFMSAPIVCKSHDVREKKIYKILGMNFKEVFKFSKVVALLVYYLSLLP